MLFYAAIFKKKGVGNKISVIKHLFIIKLQIIFYFYFTK